MATSKAREDSAKFVIACSWDGKSQDCKLN